MRIVRAHASEAVLMEILVTIEDTLQKLLRVGHTPGLTVRFDTIGGSAINGNSARHPGVSFETVRKI